MNDELQDFEMKSDDPVEPSIEDTSDSKRWVWIAAIAVLILAVILYFWSQRDDSGEEAESAPVAAATAPESAELAEPVSSLEIGEVPALVDSDAWLREIVEQVSSHPQLAEWLLTPELIRGFVVVIDNVAEGASPRKHLKMASPEKKFSTKEDGDRVYVDPASYRRFDLLVEVIDSLDTEGTSELYRAIRPLCQEAYQDLGYPGEDFDATLARAIKRIQSVPVVDGPIELTPKVTAYQFADPALEDLSPVAKQFLRLGPENLQKLQTKLRSLALAIGLSS